MISLLKKVGGLEAEPFVKGYDICKFYHPDSPKKIEFVKHVKTLKEAQEICEGPDSSFKEGETENWYFLGYKESKSRTYHLTAWSAFR